MTYKFDSMDLVLCVALAGGFATGNWTPAVLLFTIAGIAAWTARKQEDLEDDE